MSAGGALLDDTITAVFGALIWHTQALREELVKSLDGKVPGEKVAVSDGLQQVGERMVVFGWPVRQRRGVSVCLGCWSH